MSQESKNKLKNSWFYHLMVDNKYINILYILIIVTVLIFLFAVISPIFKPVWTFIQIVSLPIILAAVFYYLTIPLVNWLCNKGIRRLYGAWIVLLFIALILFLLSLLIPDLIDQGQSFIRDWQTIWQAYREEVNQFLPTGWQSEVQSFVNDFMHNYQLENFNWQSILNRTVNSIGSFVGVLSRIIIAIFTAPIILFYMLKEGDKLPAKIASFLPIKVRQKSLTLLTEMNEQISQYIRGQILVAISVAIMFVIGYNIIGLQYGAVIGVAAGFLNIIPYLGSFLGMIPAIIIAIVSGPSMILKVAIVFAIEQTIESRVISPQILGSNLEIHPITIMLLLIAGGNMFGVLGVIVIIPVYAVLKVIFIHLFEWYQRVSGLYDEADILPESNKDN
ncbi:MAG: AI-2E family transporter [Aerococcus suis]|nr:AI-2E family transporter [Aerococcus suis]MDD7758747.1 AI-2E family transporter [Aerococcus suis]MDY4646908.1 AI-2E family transporter [Aerococcus suis]